MAKLGKFFKNVWKTCGKLAVDTAVGLPGNILGDSLSDALQSAIAEFREKKGLKAAATKLIEDEHSERLLELLGDIADELEIGVTNDPVKKAEVLCKDLMAYLRGRSCTSAEAMDGFLSKSKTYCELTDDEWEAVQTFFFNLRKAVLTEEIKSLSNESRALLHGFEALLEPEAFAEKVANVLLSAGGGAQAAEAVRQKHAYTYFPVECPDCLAKGKHVRASWNGVSGMLTCGACGGSFAMTLEQNRENALSEEHFDATLNAMAEGLGKKIDWAKKEIVDEVRQAKADIIENDNRNTAGLHEHMDEAGAAVTAGFNAATDDIVKRVIKRMGEEFFRPQSPADAAHDAVIKAKEAELDRLWREKRELNAELKRLREQKKQPADAPVQSVTPTVPDNAAELKSTIEHLQKTLETMTNSFERQQSEIERQNAEIRQQNQELKRLREQPQAQQTVGAAHAADIKEKEAELDRLRQEKREMAAEMKGLREQIKQFSEQIKVLQEQLEKIKRHPAPVAHPAPSARSAAKSASAPKPPVYRIEGDYVWFGEYPQSLKEPHVRITMEKDSRGYYLGSDGAYYAEVTGAAPYEFGEPKFANGEKPVKGGTYYFKVEPIKWRVLGQSNTKALLLCESILAAKRFDTISNDYAESKVRKWLNEDFFQAAFTQEQQAAVLTTRVDNSAASTVRESNPYVCKRNPYACKDTEDKVLLLSVFDATHTDYGFSIGKGTDKSRVKRPSDYAFAMGAFKSSTGCGWWWLRSPGSSFSGYAHRVFDDGSISSSNIRLALYGVAPALQIRL